MLINNAISQYEKNHKMKRKICVASTLVLCAFLCACSNTNDIVNTSSEKKDNVSSSTTTMTTTTAIEEEKTDDVLDSSGEYEHVLAKQPDGKYYPQYINHNPNSKVSYTYDNQTGTLIAKGDDSSAENTVEVYYEKKDDKIIFTVKYFNNIDEDIVAEVIAEAFSGVYSDEINSTTPGVTPDEVEIKAGETYTLTCETNIPKAEDYSIDDLENPISVDDYYAGCSVLYYIAEPSSLSDSVIDLAFKAV